MLYHDAILFILFRNLGRNNDSNIKALILLQKLAIRVVCKCSKYDHTNILFSKLSTLKLKDIIKYKTGIVMYKAYHNILPDNVQKLMTTRKSHYNTRKSYNSNVIKYCVRTNLRQMSISYRGINVWNKLDPEVKCATTVSDLKNKLKTQLLGNYIKEELKFSLFKIKLAAICVLIWYLLSEIFHTYSTDII